MSNLQNTKEVFQWHKDFELGIELLDFQHKKIVQLINKLATFSADHQSIIKVNEVIDEIIDYTNYHFNDEEKVWNQKLLADNFIVDHQIAHQKFILVTDKLRRSIDESNIKLTVRNILDILMQWLANHILKEDKYMSLTIKNLASDYTLMEAKQLAQKTIQDEKDSLNQLMQSYKELTFEALDSYTKHQS